MVNIELFKSILFDEKPKGYIDNGDFIPFELVSMMSEAKEVKVKTLFKDVSTTGWHFMVELKCTKCGKISVHEMAKTKLFEILHGYRNTGKRYNRISFVCEDCKKIEEEDAKIKRKIDNEKTQEFLKINTYKYIDIFLNPNKIWDKGVKTWVKINDISDSSVLKDVIAKHIKEMDYYDFLQTPYWKAISEKVKQRAGWKCQLCGSNYNLNTHHRDYSIHGYELDNMKSLICLCEDCHSKFHDK